MLNGAWWVTLKSSDFFSFSFRWEILKRKVQCRGSRRTWLQYSLFQVRFFDPRGRPQSLPIVITIFTLVDLLSVTKLQNQATITAGRDYGLAEWIINDSCLVLFFLSQQHFLLPFSVVSFSVLLSSKSRLCQTK